MFPLFKFLQYSPFDKLVNWRKFIGQSNKKPLSILLESVMLRRTQREVTKSGSIERLPKKTVIKQYITLSEEERDVYDQFMNLSRAIFFKFLEYSEETYSQDAYDKAFEALHPKIADRLQEITVKEYNKYVLLLRLRQIATHPHLIMNQLPEECAEGLNVSHSTCNLPNYDLLSKLMSGQDIIGENFDDEEENPWEFLSRSNPVYDSEYRCSKALVLLPLVREKLKENEKVIIVSAFTKFLEIIGHMLSEEDIAFDSLTGKTSLKERNRIRKYFSHPEGDVKVLLLAINVGSGGLNLQGANNMFIMDLNWNPQKELQTMKRIHRIGQTKPVTIFK